MRATDTTMCPRRYRPTTNLKGITLVNNALRYAVTVLLAGLTLLFAAPATAAHRGPIKLEVTGDGAHNVNVLVTWKRDGHPVTDVVVAKLVATSTDGRTFGPVPLRSSSEGQNLYTSPEPLPSGAWDVTVTATEPAKARVTTKVEAKDIVAAAPATAAAPRPRAAVAAPVAGSEDAAATPITIGIIALAVMVALDIWIVLARRSRLYARR
jgi:nitrogen fixation protein FixH